jgi:hypothetical protein
VVQILARPRLHRSGYDVHCHIFIVSLRRESRHSVIFLYFCVRRDMSFFAFAVVAAVCVCSASLSLF